MAIKLIKEKIVQEDIEWGFGKVTQKRNISNNGLQEKEYFRINAGSIPISVPASSTVEEAIKDVYTKAESDGRFPLTSSVLTKTNTTLFTPTASYHPATMKFVLDTVTNVGAGDMTKAVYDPGNTGIVNKAYKIEDTGLSNINVVRGSVTNVDNASKVGSYVGTDVIGSPVGGPIVLEVLNNSGTIVQRLSSASNGGIQMIRFKSGATWSTWVDMVSSDLAVTSKDLSNEHRVAEMVSMTQSDYDLLPNKIAEKLYVIKG